MTEPQHGGARSGAGRRYLNGSDPHEGQAAERVTITVTRATLEKARELGDGNVSDGFRRAVEMVSERENEMSKNTAKYRCPRCREVTERRYEKGDKAPMCCGVRAKRIGR